jgi:putative ABC transport system permease protein
MKMEIEAVRVSFRALRANKMRSALTMLGIIIGVASVIVMLAVGSGAREKIGAQIASMGSNLLMILPGASTSGGARMGAGSMPTLTLADAEAIAQQCPAVDDAAPSLNGPAQVVYGPMNWSTGVNGVTPSFLSVREWPVASGRGLAEADVKTAAKVALLGQTALANLFFGEDPVGKTLRIKNIPFEVVGTLAAKGQSPMGQDQDDVILIPVTAAQKKVFGTPFPGMVRTITVKAASLAALPDAERQITDLLRQRHHIGVKQDNDFTVRNLTQLMQASEQAAATMSLLLGSVASVSLLVGGIGIMNIMLVSVTERTREIGVRMAFGATARDIRLQFIIEALTLSILGGAAGIILGIGVAGVLARTSEWPAVISAASIALSFLFAGVVGVAFGFYPAYKASALNPMDALRYE